VDPIGISGLLCWVKVILFLSNELRVSLDTALTVLTTIPFIIFY